MDLILAQLQLVWIYDGLARRWDRPIIVLETPQRRADGDSDVATGERQPGIVLEFPNVYPLVGNHALSFRRSMDPEPFSSSVTLLHLGIDSQVTVYESLIMRPRNGHRASNGRLKAKVVLELEATPNSVVPVKSRFSVVENGSTDSPDS